MADAPEKPATLRVEGFGDVPAQTKLLAWQVQGLQYTASGYGSRIPTSRMVQVENRWYRVYCMIFGNSGTCYIMRRGQRLRVDD